MFNSSYRTKFPNSSSEDDSDYGENRTMSQTPATATTTSPPPPHHQQQPASSSSGQFHRPFASSRVNLTGDDDDDDDEEDDSSPPPLKFPLDPPEDLMDLEPSEVNHKVSSQICTSSSVTSERIFGAHNEFMELNKAYIVYNSRVLGKGSFGEVKLCYCRADKSFYALKILNKKQLEKLRMGLAGDNLIDKVLEEIEIMKKIRHENVIALKEVIDDTVNGRIYLILELAEYGTLFAMNNGFVEEDEDGRVQIPENAVKELTVSLVEALSHAHEVAHVAHRDIKPENILLNNDNQVKLSDFGVGCFVSHHQQESLVREGSISFLPPEMLLPITDKMVVAAPPSTPGFGLTGAASGTWGEASGMYSPLADQLAQSAYGSQTHFMSVNSLTNLASNSTLAQHKVSMGSGHISSSGGMSPKQNNGGGGSTNINNNADPPPFSLSSQQQHLHHNNNNSTSNEASHQEHPLDPPMINFKRKSSGGSGVYSDECTNTRSTNNNDILSPIRQSPYHEHLAQPEHSLEHTHHHNAHNNTTTNDDVDGGEDDDDLSKSNKSKSEGLSDNNEQMLNISFAGRMGAGPFQRDFSAAGTPRMRSNGDPLQQSSSTHRRRRPTKTLSSPHLTSGRGSMRRRPPLPTSPHSDPHSNGNNAFAAGTPTGGRSSSFILSNDVEDDDGGGVAVSTGAVSIGSGHIDLLAATDLGGGGSLGRRGGLGSLLGNVDDLCRSTNTNGEDVVGSVDQRRGGGRGDEDDDNLYLNHLPKTPGMVALASVDRANSPAYDPHSTSASPSPRRPGRERTTPTTPLPEATTATTVNHDTSSVATTPTGDNNSTTLVPSGLPPRPPSQFKSRPISSGSSSVPAFSSQDEDDEEEEETSSRRTSSLSERPGEDGAGGEAFSYLSNSQAPLSALKHSVSQQRMLSSSFCGSPLTRGGFAGSGGGMDMRQMSPLTYGLDASVPTSSTNRRFLPHQQQPRQQGVDDSIERMSPQLHPTASSRGDSIFWEGLSAATPAYDDPQHHSNNTTHSPNGGGPPITSPTSNNTYTGTSSSAVSSPLTGGGGRGTSTQRPPLVPNSHPIPLSKSPHHSDSAALRGVGGRFDSSCPEASGSPGHAALTAFQKFESGEGAASGNTAAGASNDSAFPSISLYSQQWSPAQHAANQHLQQIAPPLAALQSEHNSNMAAAAASTLGYANLGWRTINRNEVDLFKADVWALGVTVFVMLHGHLPWMAHAGLPPKTHRSSQDRARLLHRLKNMMVAKSSEDEDNTDKSAQNEDGDDNKDATITSSASPEISTLRIESIYKACAVPQWLQDSDNEEDNDAADCGEDFKFASGDFSGSIEGTFLTSAIENNINNNKMKEQRADGLNSSSSSLIDGENAITTRLDPYSRYRLKKYRKWRDRKFRAERHNNRLRREINYITASFEAFVDKHAKGGQVDRRGSRHCSRQSSKSVAHKMARSNSEFADIATPLQNRSKYHSFVNSGPNSGTKFAAASRSSPATLIESPTGQNPPDAESTMRGDNANQFIAMSGKHQFPSTGSLQKDNSMNSTTKQQLHGRRSSGTNLFPPQGTPFSECVDDDDAPLVSYTAGPPAPTTVNSLSSPSAAVATTTTNNWEGKPPVSPPTFLPVGKGGERASGGGSGGGYDAPTSMGSTPSEGTLLSRRTPLAPSLQLLPSSIPDGSISATNSSGVMFPTLEQAIIQEHLNSNNNSNSPNSPYLVMKYQPNVKGHYHSSNRTSPMFSPASGGNGPTATPTPTTTTTTVVKKESPLGLAFTGVAAFLSGQAAQQHQVQQQQPSSSNNSNNASRKYLYSPNVQSVSRAEMLLLSYRPPSTFGGSPILHLPGMLLSSSQRDLVAAAVIHRQNRQWKLNGGGSTKSTPKHENTVTSTSFIRVTESESTDGGGDGSSSTHTSGYHHNRPTFVKINDGDLGGAASSSSSPGHAKDSNNTAMFHTTHPRVLQIMRNEERDDRRNIERANWEYWTTLVKKSSLIIEDCPPEEEEGSLLSVPLTSNGGGGISRQQSNSRRERSTAHSTATSFKAGAPPPAKYSRLDCRAPEERQLLAILANPDPVRMLHSHMISEQPLHREDGEYTEEMAKMTLEHIEQLREVEFATQAAAAVASPNSGLQRAMSTSLSHNHLPSSTTPAGDDEFENDFYVGGGGRHQHVETPAGCDSPAKNPSELGGTHNLPTIVKMTPNAFIMNSSETSYVDVPTTHNNTGGGVVSSSSPKDGNGIGGMSPLDNHQHPLPPSSQQLLPEGSCSSHRPQPTPTQTFMREASNLHLQRSMFSLANSFQVSPATLERNLSELGSAFGHRPPSTPGSTPAFHGVDNSSIVGGLLLPQSSSVGQFGSYGASGTDVNASFAENASFAYGSFSAVVNFLPKGRRNPSNSAASGSPSINPNNVSVTSEQHNLLNSRSGPMMPPSRAPSAEEPTLTPLSPAPIRCDTDIISSNVASDDYAASGTGGENTDGVTTTAVSSPTVAPPAMKIKATVIKRRDGLRTRRVCRREPNDMKKRLQEFQQRLRASVGPTTSSPNYTLPQKRTSSTSGGGGKAVVSALDEKCLHRSTSSHHSGGAASPSTQLHNIVMCGGDNHSGGGGGYSSRTPLRRGDRSSSWDGMRTVESEEIPFLRNPPNHNATSATSSSAAARNDLPLGPSFTKSMLGRQRGYSETSQSDGGGGMPPPAYTSRSDSEVIPTFVSPSTRTGQNNTPLGTGTGSLMLADGAESGKGGSGVYSNYYPSSWDNTRRNTDATRRTGSSPGASDINTGSFAFAVGSGLGSGGGGGGSGYKSRSSDLVVNQQTSTTHTARDTPPSIQVARRSAVAGGGGGDNTSGVDEGLVVFNSGNMRPVISRNHSATMGSGLLDMKHVNSSHHMDPHNKSNDNNNLSASTSPQSPVRRSILTNKNAVASGTSPVHGVGGEVIPVNSNSFAQRVNSNANHLGMMRSIASVVSEEGDPNNTSNPYNHHHYRDSAEGTAGGGVGDGDLASFAMLDGAALEDLNDVVFCSTSDSQHSFLSTVDSEPDFYMGDDEDTTASNTNNNASIVNGGGGGNSVNYYNAAFADIGLHTEGEIGDLFISCFKDSSIAAMQHLHPTAAMQQSRSQHQHQSPKRPESPTPTAFTSASSRTTSRRPTFVPGGTSHIVSGSPTASRVSPMHSTSHYTHTNSYGGGGVRTPTGGIAHPNIFGDTTTAAGPDTNSTASPYSPTWARQASATFGTHQHLNQSSSVHGKKGDLRKEHFDIAQFFLSRRSTSDEVKALQVKLKTTVAKAVAVIHQQMEAVTAATSASDNLAISGLARSQINPPVTPLTVNTNNNEHNSNAAFGQHFASRTGSEANYNNGTPTTTAANITTTISSNPLTIHQPRILRRRASSTALSTPPNVTGLSNPISGATLEEDELTGFVGLDRSPSGADGGDVNSMINCTGFSSSGPLSNAQTTMTTTTTTASNTMAVTIASSCADSPRVSPKATIIQANIPLASTALPQDSVPRMLASDSSSEANDDSSSALPGTTTNGPALFLAAPLFGSPLINNNTMVGMMSGSALANSISGNWEQPTRQAMVELAKKTLLHYIDLRGKYLAESDPWSEDDDDNDHHDNHDQSSSAAAAASSSASNTTAQTRSLLASVPQSVSTLFDVFCQTLITKMATSRKHTAMDSSSGLPLPASMILPKYTSPQSSSNTPSGCFFPVTAITTMSSTRFDNNDESSDLEMRRSPRQKSTNPSSSFRGSRRASQEVGEYSIDLCRGTATPPCAEGGLVGSMATMSGGGHNNANNNNPAARLKTLNSIQSFESFSALPQSKSPYVRPDTELLGAKTQHSSCSDGLDARGALATPQESSTGRPTPSITPSPTATTTNNLGGGGRGGYKEIYEVIKAILDQDSKTNNNNTSTSTRINIRESTTNKSDAHIAGNSTIVAVIYSTLISDNVQLSLDDLNDPAEISMHQKSMTMNDVSTVVTTTADNSSTAGTSGASTATTTLGQLVGEVSTSDLNESAKEEVGKEWSILTVEELTSIIIKSVGEVANAMMRRYLSSSGLPAAASTVRPSSTLSPGVASSEVGMVNDNSQTTLQHITSTTQQRQHQKEGDSHLAEQLSNSSSHLHINSAANSRTGGLVELSAAAAVASSSPLNSGTGTGTGTSRKQSGSRDTATGSSINFGSNLNLFGATTMISGDFVAGEGGGSSPSHMLQSNSTGDAAQAYSPISAALSMFPPSSNLAKRLADFQELFPSTTVTSTIESFRKRKERRRTLRKGLIKKQLKYVVGMSKRCGANYNRTVQMSKMGDNYGVQAVARLAAEAASNTNIEVVDEKGADAYVDQSEWNTKIEDQGEDDLAFYTTPAFNKCSISHFRECTAGCTSESISFIRAALRLDPATRPAMKDLLEHPWLTDLYRERCEERRLEAEKQQAAASTAATPEQLLTPFRSVDVATSEARHTEEVAASEAISASTQKSVNRVVLMGTLQNPDDEDDPLSVSLDDGQRQALPAMMMRKPSSSSHVDNNNNNSNSGGVFGTSSNTATNDCSVTFGVIDPTTLAETAANLDGKTIGQAVSSSASQSFTTASAATAHVVPASTIASIVASPRTLPVVPSTTDIINVATASPSPIRDEVEDAMFVTPERVGKKTTTPATTAAAASSSAPRRKSTTVAGGGATSTTTTSRRRGRITFAELIQRTQDNKTMRRTKLGMEGEGKNPLVGTHGFTKPAYRIDTTDVADSIITNRGGAGGANINPLDVGSPLFASSVRMSKNRRQRSNSHFGGEDGAADPSDSTLQSRLRRQRSQSKIVINKSNNNNNTSSMDSGALDSMSLHYSPDPTSTTSSKRSNRRQSVPTSHQQSPKLGTYTAVKSSSGNTKSSSVTCGINITTEMNAATNNNNNSKKLEIPLPFSPLRSSNDSVGVVVLPGGQQQQNNQTEVQSPTFSQVREYGSSLNPGSQRGSGYVRDLQSSFRFNRDDPRMANWSAVVSSPPGTVHPGSSHSSSVRIASLAESPTVAGPPSGLCGSVPSRIYRGTSSSSLRHQRGSITNKSLHSQENSPCNAVVATHRSGAIVGGGDKLVPSPVFGMRSGGSSSSYPTSVNVSTRLHLCDGGEDDSGDESVAMPDPPNNSFQSNVGIIVSEEGEYTNTNVTENSSDTTTTRQDSNILMAATPPTPIMSTRGSNLGVDAPPVRRTVSFTTHTTADREALSAGGSSILESKSTHTNTTSNTATTKDGTTPTDGVVAVVDRTSSSLRRGSNYGLETTSTNDYTTISMMLARPTLSLPAVNAALTQMYLLQQLEDTVGNWTMDDEDGSVSRRDSALEMESTDRHPADDSVLTNVTDGGSSNVYATRVESALGASSTALLASSAFRTPQHSQRPSGIAFMSGSSDGGSNVKPTPPQQNNYNDQYQYQHNAGTPTSAQAQSVVDREHSPSSGSGGGIIGFFKRIINPKTSVSKSPSVTGSIPDNHSDAAAVNRNTSSTSVTTNTTTYQQNPQQSGGNDDAGRSMVTPTISQNTNNNLPQHAMRSLSGASAFMDARPVESDEGAGMYHTTSSRFEVSVGVDTTNTTTHSPILASATSPNNNKSTTSVSSSFPPLGPIRPPLISTSTAITTPASHYTGIFATAASSSGTSLATLMHHYPPPAAIATTNTNSISPTTNTSTSVMTAATPISSSKPPATKGMTGLSKILSVGDLLDEYDEENNNSPTHHQFHQQDNESSSYSASGNHQGIRTQSDEDGTGVQQECNTNEAVIGDGVDSTPATDQHVDVNLNSEHTRTTEASTTTTTEDDDEEEEEEPIVTTVGQEIVYSALLNASDFGLLQSENPNGDNEHLFPLRPAQMFDPAIRRAYSLMNLRGLMLGSFSPEQLRWEPFVYHDLSSNDDEEDDMMTTTTHDHSRDNTPGATRTSSVVNPNLSTSSRPSGGGGGTMSIRRCVAAGLLSPNSENPPPVFAVPYAVDVDLNDPDAPHGLSNRGRVLSSRRLSINGNDLGAPMTLCNSFSYGQQRTPTVGDNNVPSFPSRRNTILTSGHTSLTTMQHQNGTLSTGTTSTLHSQITSPTEMIPPSLMMHQSPHSPRTVNSTATATDNEENPSSSSQHQKQQTTNSRWIGPQQHNFTTTTTIVGTTSTTVDDSTTATLTNTAQSPTSPAGAATSFVSDVIPNRPRARSTISGTAPLYPALRISHSGQGLSGLTSPIAGSPRPSDGSPRSDLPPQEVGGGSSSTPTTAPNNNNVSTSMGQRTLTANEQLGGSSNTTLGGSGLLIPTPMSFIGRTPSGQQHGSPVRRQHQRTSKHHHHKNSSHSQLFGGSRNSGLSRTPSGGTGTSSPNRNSFLVNRGATFDSPISSTLSPSAQDLQGPAGELGLRTRRATTANHVEIFPESGSTPNTVFSSPNRSRKSGGTKHRSATSASSCEVPSMQDDSPLARSSHQPPVGRDIRKFSTLTSEPTSPAADFPLDGSGQLGGSGGIFHTDAASPTNASVGNEWRVFDDSPREKSPLRPPPPHRRHSSGGNDRQDILQSATTSLAAPEAVYSNNNNTSSMDIREDDDNDAWPNTNPLDHDTPSQVCTTASFSGDIKGGGGAGATTTDSDSRKVTPTSEQMSYSASVSPATRASPFSPSRRRRSSVHRLARMAILSSGSTIPIGTPESPGYAQTPGPRPLSLPGQSGAVSNSTVPNNSFSRGSQSIETLPQQQQQQLASNSSWNGFEGPTLQITRSRRGSMVARSSSTINPPLVSNSSIPSIVHNNSSLGFSGSSVAAMMTMDHHNNNTTSPSIGVEEEEIDTDIADVADAFQHNSSHPTTTAETSAAPSVGAVSALSTAMHSPQLPATIASTPHHEAHQATTTSASHVTMEDFEEEETVIQFCWRPEYGNRFVLNPMIFHSIGGRNQRHHSRSGGAASSSSPLGTTSSPMFSLMSATVVAGGGVVGGSSQDNLDSSVTGEHNSTTNLSSWRPRRVTATPGLGAIPQTPPTLPDTTPPAFTSTTAVAHATFIGTSPPTVTATTTSSSAAATSRPPVRNRARSVVSFAGESVLGGGGGGGAVTTTDSSNSNSSNAALPPPTFESVPATPPLMSKRALSDTIKYVDGAHRTEVPRMPSVNSVDELLLLPTADAVPATTTTPANPPSSMLTNPSSTSTTAAVSMDNNNVSNVLVSGSAMMMSTAYDNSRRTSGAGTTTTSIQESPLISHSTYAHHLPPVMMGGGGGGVHPHASDHHHATSQSGGSEASSTPQPSWYRREKECIVSASASSSVSPCLVAYVPNTPILGITESHHQDSNNNPVSNSDRGSSSPHPPSTGGGGGGTSGRGSVGSLPPTHTPLRDDVNSSPSRSPSKGVPPAPAGHRQFARFPVGNSVLSMMSEDDYMSSANASPRQQPVSYNYSPASSIRGSLNMGQPPMLGGNSIGGEGGYSSQTASLQQSPLKGVAAATPTTPLLDDDDDIDVREVQHVLGSRSSPQQQQHHRGSSSHHNHHHHSTANNNNTLYLLGTTQDMSECSLTGSSLTGSSTAPSGHTLARPTISENAAALDFGVVSAFGSSMASSMVAPSPNRRHSMGGSSSINLGPSPAHDSATSPRLPPAAAPINNNKNTTTTTTAPTTTIPMPSLSPNIGSGVTGSPSSTSLSGALATTHNNQHHHHHLPLRLGSYNVLPSQPSMGTLYISPASTPASTPQTTPSQGPTSNTSPFVGPGGAAASGSGSLRLGYLANTTATTPPNNSNPHNTTTTTTRVGGGVGGIDAAVSPMSSSLHPLLPPSAASLLDTTNNNRRPRSPATSLTSESNNNNSPKQHQQMERNNTGEST